MRESEIKTKMIKDIRKEGGYGRRIEDRFSVGMPDTVMIPLLTPVTWIEVKILTGNILRVSDRQYVELLRLRIPPHSLSYMLGWKEDVFYIAPPNKNGIHINSCLKQKPGEPIGDLIRRVIALEGI